MEEIIGWHRILKDGTSFAIFKLYKDATDYLDMVCDCQADYDRFEIKEVVKD